MRSVAIGAAVLLVLSACSRVSTESTGRHPWTQPGVLRVAFQTEPKTLNPLLANTTIDNAIDRFMFEPLVSADAKGNPFPMLVTVVPSLANGGISKDGLTIVYHLRKNLRWSDGVPLTSADVKWSWTAILNPDNDVISRHGYDMVYSIDTPNAQTAVVHLKHPFAPFVNTFFAESDQPYDIVPAHILSKYSNINQVPFDAAPAVSDGPFLFTDWKRGDRVDVHANPNFFLGKPHLDRIVAAFVPDENTSANLLRTHAIDYIFQASIQTYPELSQAPNIRIAWDDMNGYDGLIFNTRRPGVSDPRVRLAIAYAIDKDRIVKTLTHGQEKVATEDLPDWMWAFDPSVASYSVDLTKAKALLAQAGWKPGPDGIVRRGERPMELLFPTQTDSATHRQEALIVQSALHEIGIETEIKFYPTDMMYASEGMGGVLPSGKYDISLISWYAGLDPDDSSQFLCAMAPPNGYNFSRYCNPQMEALQGDALTHYDLPARKIAYSRIQQLLARDNPVIFIWWQRQQEPISIDFKGFAPNPAVETWNAWQWIM